MKKDKLGFEYAEHSFIGDAIYLTLPTGQRVPAIDHRFRLKNGLTVTYGQINGLAGDFYGTHDPISDGRDANEQSKRFLAAYNTLADGGSRQPEEAKSIQDVLQAEVYAINDALKHHEDPSVAYNKLPDVSSKLEALTFGRSGIPGYLGLAQINWDHFGKDARTAYNAGHATALQIAADGDLEGAYALNAFADHFLQDCFSAGHLRTPRRFLHRSLDIAADVCAKFMHDEDNAIGIAVTNPSGQSWIAFGDKRALDEVDAENRKRCVATVQLSANEVYDAYKTKHIPAPTGYKAWTQAPTLDSARSTQTLTPLFTFGEERRKVIKNRRNCAFKSDWWFWSTAVMCKTSGWWKYPITIDGPTKIVPWTNFAVTSPRTQSSRVYYQNPQGGVLESAHEDGMRTGGVDGPVVFETAPFTPLAAISWAGGTEVRVYYLNEENKLCEYCYSWKKGNWFPGELVDMKIQAAANTSIAAFQYGGANGVVHIRVYCQELGSNEIKEFCNDGQIWFRGAILPSALSGTSIAGVVYASHGLQFRIFYQGDDLSLHEHCLGDKGWHPGQFSPGKAPSRTPISALGWDNNEITELQVYWMNTQQDIVQMRHNSKWGHTSKIYGKYVRLYYQSIDNPVLEVCNDKGQLYSGATVAQATSWTLNADRNPLGHDSCYGSPLSTGQA